ncbi:DAK2 domain-containing protein [Cytobacillus sp. IB215316]|uniref:DAK2 domain-containing protein n=1 Tax=Cytobacillus sp. IB215316 TaxID=3097354 RepID=UPI002A136CC3|nr:DAK2 domain-containing protein [Cytobacillus sp. IB215316]MDX8362293.1 DAK2 domain-containing protein [Cytobacillus sp. IB215316]
MSLTKLSGERFIKMVIQGSKNLANHSKLVDALNVFPVPDGDTGTNMNLSMSSGAKEVSNVTSDHIGKVGKSLSKGLLMGARGNSGVILSQLFRGFATAIEHKESINSVEFAEAFASGVKTAYKSVMKPVEGTILTVAKDAANRGLSAAEHETDIILLMEEIVKEARSSLSRTPELLPVLKEVGVVDSGGQGLVFVYEGFLAELKDETIIQSSTIPTMTELINAEHHKSIQSHMDTEDIEFGYCTEFMVKFSEDNQDTPSFSQEQFRNDLSAHGDSLLVVADEEVVKVHIHTEEPGEVLSYGKRYGSLINMKIENMREQHSNIVNTTEEIIQPREVAQQKPYGIISVAMGSGIADLFKSIGAHSVIEGGQTMNPSTEDFVNAINEVNADNIIILPNNKNIILAAQQAATVVEGNVVVIPSKTVPQGMVSLLAFNPTIELTQNEQLMTDALSGVKTGQVTYAIRDTNIDGLDISKNDFMGINDGKIDVTNEDKVAVAKELLDNMIDEDDEIITILFGEDAAEDEVEELVSYIEAQHSEIEVEVHNGKQPLYSFVFAIE